MKRKENKKNFREIDNFERKSGKGLAKKDKSTKRRLTIYDEFEEEEELDDYYEEEEEEDDDYYEEDIDEEEDEDDKNY